MAKKKSVKAEKSPTHSITLQVGEIAYQGKGSSFAEALEKLQKPNKPIVIKTLVTLEHNGAKRTYPLVPLKARRYYMRIARPFVAKELDILL